MGFYKWAGFGMAIWVMTISGSNYTLSNYSGALKSVLKINQVQLNTLSVGKDLGKALGIVAGLASNYIPPWAVLLVGSTLGFIGFGTQWLVVSGTINPLPYWTMFVSCALGGNSVSWFNTAVLLVCVRNFPRNRGPVIGLLKGYLGLSAAIFSAFCDFLFSGTSSSFLLILSITPSIVCTVAAPFLRPVMPTNSLQEDRRERQNVFWFNAFATGLALYIALVEIFSPSNTLEKRVCAGCLSLLLIAPVVVPIIIGMMDFDRPSWFNFFKKKKMNKNQISNGSSVDEKKGLPSNDIESSSKLVDALAEAKEPLLETSDISTIHGDIAGEGEDAVSPAKPKGAGCMELGALCGPRLPELGENRTILQVLRSVDFWLFYVSCLCSGGVGIAFSNNLGQIGEAIGFDTITRFTILFSTGGFAGRILSGLVSEHFLRRAGVPRPVWTVIAKLPMIVVLLWLSEGSQRSLYVGTVVMGFCYGFHMAVMIPMVSEFYGLKHFGSNYNICMTVLLVGSLLFSDLLAGVLYDKEAFRQQGLLIPINPDYGIIIGQPIITTPIWPSPFLREDSSLTCYGSKCYRLTFIIFSGVLVMGLALDVLLIFITRPLYKKIQRINTAASA